MKERSIVTRRDLKLTAISCDRCGKDMVAGTHEGNTQWDPREGGMTPVLNPEEVCFIDGESAEISFGYGSKMDLTTVEFDLCTDCWVWFFRELDHVVVRHGRGGISGEGTYDQAQNEIDKQFQRINLEWEAGKE